MAEIARALPISRPAVSQHLRVLKDADLVVVRVEGRRRIYQASPDALLALRAQLDAFWATAMASFRQIADEERKAPDDQSDRSE